jgi:hypothetical protein
MHLDRGRQSPGWTVRLPRVFPNPSEIGPSTDQGDRFIFATRFSTGRAHPQRMQRWVCAGVVGTEVALGLVGHSPSTNWPLRCRLCCRPATRLRPAAPAVRVLRGDDRDREEA